MIMALAFFGLLLAVAVSIIVTVGRQWARVRLLVDDFLDLDHRDRTWTELDFRGWARTHVDQVTDLLIDPQHRIDPNGRRLAKNGRLAARMVLSMAADGAIPGACPEHQVAWISALVVRRPTASGSPFLRRQEILRAPDPADDTATMDQVAAQMHTWTRAFGPTMAPLFAAAGLSFTEAQSAVQTGGLDEERLRVLAALRSDITSTPIEVI